MSFTDHDALLKAVSRSFYLSMRFLPPEMREPVSLGYLLARFTDTVADAPGLPDAERLSVLDSVRIGIQKGRLQTKLDLSAFRGALSHEGERHLLGKSDDLFEWYAGIDDSLKDHLSEVILTIVHGQCWDINSFQNEVIAPCQSGEDTLRYAYWVAGCVGEFWTKVGFSTMGKRFSEPENAAAMLVRGRKLGQGLQLINILRDLHEDLPEGRLYLPREEVLAAGWNGDGVPSAGFIEPVYEQWLGTCVEFLEEAEPYLSKVNDASARFCTRLPMLLARATAGEMAAAGFDRVVSEKVKVPRSTVWKAMGRAIFF